MSQESATSGRSFLESFNGITTDGNLLEKRKTLPYRTIAAAVFLTLVGLICLLMGLVQIVLNGKTPLSFITIGALTLLPGGYHLYLLLQTYRGVPGYSLDSIPSYESA